MFSRTGIAADEASQSGNGVFAANSVVLHRPRRNAHRADGRDVAVASGAARWSRDSAASRHGDPVAAVLLMEMAALSGRSNSVRHGHWQLERSAEDRNREGQRRIAGRR